MRERTGVEVRVLGVEGFWQRMLLVRPAQAGEEDRRVRDAAAMVIEHMARSGLGGLGLGCNLPPAGSGSGVTGRAGSARASCEAPGP